MVLLRNCLAGSLPMARAALELGQANGIGSDTALEVEKY